MPRSTPFAGYPRFRAVILLLFGWLGFFAFLELLSVVLAPASANRHFEYSAPAFVGGVVWTVLSMVIFNYHRWLRDRIPRLLPLIAAHLPMLFVAGGTDAFFTSWSVRNFTPTPPQMTVLAMLVYYLDFAIVSYLIIVTVAELVLVRRALADRKRQADRLEQSLARARLDYLEAQLQPHFLFNSLGAVSELAYDAPATATRVLRQLASIFRTALGRKTDEVTLGEEIVGIEPYLDIQRIRFADWLTIDYRVDDAAVDCLVPRFVLQPLIENAIRHGLSGRSSAGTIEIAASVHDGWLVVQVVDNGVGLEAAPASTGRGIGLSNVRDRLRILYGDDESLRLSSNESGGAVAELRVPVRRRDSATPVVATDRTDTQIVESLQPISIPAFLQRPVVATIVVWLVLGLAWTQQSYVYLILRGRPNDAAWLALAKIDLTTAGLWAACTPLVFWFASRFPLRRSGIVWRAIVYIAFGAAVLVAHNVLWQRISWPGTSPFTSAYVMAYAVGAMIIVVLVAAAHRHVLTEWLRVRETDAEALRAELDEARVRAEKLQAIPPVLLHSLDGIAESARRDPSLTERQLTRLADYLRLALECTDERGITPERERALDAAVAELRSTGAYSLTLIA